MFDEAVTRRTNPYFNIVFFGPPSYALSCGLCYTFDNARLWIPFQSIIC